jgi:phosphoribosyl-ATP pyrophosphohydrolase
MSAELLQRLAEVLDARRGADPQGSYVAGLHARGIDAILKKVGEESAEVLLAAKNVAAGEEPPERLVSETADLWFHSLVMLSHLGLGPADVLAELERRFGVGGLQEKASRG